MARRKMEPTAFVIIACATVIALSTTLRSAEIELLGTIPHPEPIKMTRLDPAGFR